MNLVLFEPEKPANTGNIGRTCVVTGTTLHIIGPLTFSLSDKAAKRAGMDYWPRLDYRYYMDYADFCEKNPGARIYYATTKAHQLYTEVSYGEDDFLMFGPESRGIPEEILVDHEDTCVRIPMRENERSLNLADSAAIVLYEALRQNQFRGLEPYGRLHRMHWKSEESYDEFC